MSIRELRYVILLVSIFCISSSLSAQKRGFVRTKGALYEQGKIIYSTTNPEEVSFSKDGKRITRYPISEVKSFGYLKRFGNDSIVYESAVITIAGSQQEKFLKRLASGKHVLLQFETQKDRFFYRNGETITELTKSNYKGILKSLIEGKKAWMYQVNKVSFNRTRLSMFFLALNAKRNMVINLPKTQLMGALVSGEVIFGNVLGINDFLSEEPADIDEMFFGISHYMPFSGKLRLGFISQLSYEQFSALAEERSQEQDRSIVANFDRLLLEITPSYRITNSRIAAYLFGGISGGLVFNDSSEYFEANFSDGNEITFNTIIDPVKQESVHLGLVYGAGFDLIITPKVVASFEYRLNESFGNTGIIESITTNKLTFKIGL